MSRTETAKTRAQARAGGSEPLPNVQAWNNRMQSAATGLGVVSLLAFLVAFRLKTPTPENESEVRNGVVPEV